MRVVYQTGPLWSRERERADLKEFIEFAAALLGAIAAAGDIPAPRECLDGGAGGSSRLPNPSPRPNSMRHRRRRPLAVAEAAARIGERGADFETEIVHGRLLDGIDCFP
jgi:hypothetical protein